MHKSKHEETKMDKNVRKVLNEQVWYLATYDKEPNAVPVAFKTVLEDGTLAVGDVFMETTLRNIQANRKIAVSVCNASTMEGYQIKGTAQYVTSGETVKMFKQQVETLFQGKTTAKGVLIITPERVIVTTPGPENKKEL